MSNAPSKPVSFSRPKVGYFSNRPRTSCWRTCMMKDSQQFILMPLLQAFNSSMVCFGLPYACLLFNMCKSKLGCLFLCILYVLRVVLLLSSQFGQHMNYCRCCILVYIYHLSLFCVILSLSCLYIVLVSRKDIFKLVCLNKVVIFCISGL